MTITPRSRPPLLDQRLPSRRPPQPQAVFAGAPAEEATNIPPPFPLWLIPIFLLLATCVFLTVHFTTDGVPQAGSPQTGPDSPLAVGIRPEKNYDLIGRGFDTTIGPTPSVAVHKMDKLPDDGIITVDMKALYGIFGEGGDSAATDSIISGKEFATGECLLVGSTSTAATGSCTPKIKKMPNLNFPKTYVDFLVANYNATSDTTAFSYNVCSQDTSLVAAVTFSFQGTCCVKSYKYFGTTTMGGLDTRTCNYGFTLDSAFSKPQCVTYTINYKGKVPTVKRTNGGVPVTIILGPSGDTPQVYMLQTVDGPDCRSPFVLTTATNITKELGQGDDFVPSPSPALTPSAFVTEGIAQPPTSTYAQEQMPLPEQQTQQPASTPQEEPQPQTTPASTPQEEPQPQTTSTPEENPQSQTTDSIPPPPKPPQNYETAPKFPDTLIPPPETPAAGLAGPTGTADSGGGAGSGSSGSVGSTSSGGIGGGSSGGGGGGGSGSSGSGGGGGGASVPGTIISGGTGYTDAVSVQKAPQTNTSLYSTAIEDCTPNGDIGYHSKSGQDEAVFEIYYSNPYKCGGVVVEVDAGDGTTSSSSYFFEYAMKWKAVLFEANPDVYSELKNSRPQASTFNGAFCNNTDKQLTYSQGAFFTSDSKDISSVNATRSAKEMSAVTVSCLSISTELSKLNIRHADVIYISVSGNAFAVLNSFDFTQISVSIWVLDLDPLDDYYEPISAKLTDYGYVKAEWDIKRWCPPVFGKCTNNEVWLEARFNPLPDPVLASSRRLSEIGTPRLYDTFSAKHNNLRYQSQ